MRLKTHLVTQSIMVSDEDLIKTIMDKLYTDKQDIYEFLKECVKYVDTKNTLYEVYTHIQQGILLTYKGLVATLTHNNPKTCKLIVYSRIYPRYRNEYTYEELWTLLMIT